MSAMTEQPGGHAVDVAAARFDVERWRRDFPALQQEVHGRPLVYLDNAATTQKPRAVLDAERAYYEHDNANVHRGVHTLSVRATRAYEGARQRVRSFLNARDVAEVVFVRGATEALNLVAQTFARERLGPGDEVLITALEHHSNIVPWQMVCAQTGAVLSVVPIDSAGQVRRDEFTRRLSPRTRIVALGHVSNALGTVNPVAALAAEARAAGAAVVVDGAQATPHLRVDVQALGCDFYACSGHKMYGPTGIGVLYGRREHLEAMPPYQGGGEMIRSVTFEATTYAPPPHKFEAGTPNIAGAVGLAAAVEYLDTVRHAGLVAYEQELLAYAAARLGELPEVRRYGAAAEQAGVLSFTLVGVHPHDVGTLLDQEGIAIRAGHHCAQPLMARLGVVATCRASLAFYNTRGEIDALAAGLRRALQVFAE
jgi:cysteine desulfurase / selenocysteine lyase